MRVVVSVALFISMSVGIRAADRVTPPPVPGDIEVPAGFKPFFWGHAVGTQNFICTVVGTNTEWFFIGPQATLFDANSQQVATHFQSKNPFRNNDIHASWQHSRDTSITWATRFAGSLDSQYVAPGAIEWLLLEVKGGDLGPTGGDKFAKTRFIQRVNTVGGLKPPASECNASTLNNRKLVAYEADYYFFQ